MASWYEIFSNDSGQHSFVLKAANSQVILRSQQYASKGAARTGIVSVQKNSLLDRQCELGTATGGRFYSNLKAGNNQVIGTSQMYTSQDSCRRGVKSVQTHGPSVDVRDA